MFENEKKLKHFKFEMEHLNENLESAREYFKFLHELCLPNNMKKDR